MSADYSVEEVRAHARMLRECRINTEATRDRQQDKLADICDAYADLLERIKTGEGVVPFGYAYRYADGIKLGGGGRERNGMRPTEAIPLFAHPPAQAAQVPTDLADFVRGMHTLELYNASTDEPYFDCNGSDMWCSTEDFAGKDGEKFVRFLFGCAEFVKAQLNAASTAYLAQPRAVPDGCETVKSNSLPPGYTLGHSKKDGGYWPLLKDAYIGTGWYATQAEAELVAWKHAHGKLDSYMREIRRLAAAPSPGESA